MPKFMWLPLLIAAAPLWAGAPTAPDGRAVLQQMIEAWENKDAQATLTMTIVNPKGQQRVRTLTSWQKRGPDGLSKGLIKFVEPADVKGTGFLTVETGNNESDQFLYMPAFNKTKRIASGQKGERFMGSDFTYEDLEPRDLDDGEHRWVKSEKLFDIDTDLVETTVKRADSQYSRLETWIRRDNHLPFQIKMYNRQGELSKRLYMLGFDQVEGQWVITRMKMEDVQEGSNTTMDSHDIKLEQGLDDEIFTQRNLEKPL